MTDDALLLRRLIAGEPSASAAVLDRSRSSSDPGLLVAAALLSTEPGPLLDRAEGVATSSRDRQLVAVARAGAQGDDELLDALVRDHLADHPDHLLAAWIADRHVVAAPTGPMHRPTPNDTKEHTTMTARPTPIPTTPISPTVPAPTRRSRPRLVARWLATFAGFPLGGLTASLLVGPVDALPAAVAGGLVTGAILGAVQSWGLARGGPATRWWALATGAGLAVGLGTAAPLVGYGTSATDLALQGALCGVAVGAAQAVVLRPRLGRIAFAWPAWLAGVWALGWTITTSIGVDVENQFTVFGSSGAVVVAGLTSVLPLVLARSEEAAR
jgi:hypothetical protein